MNKSGYTSEYKSWTITLEPGKDVHIWKGSGWADVKDSGTLAITKKRGVARLWIVSTPAGVEISGEEGQFRHPTTLDVGPVPQGGTSSAEEIEVATPIYLRGTGSVVVRGLASWR